MAEPVKYYGTSVMLLSLYIQYILLGSLLNPKLVVQFGFSLYVTWSVVVVFYLDHQSLM